MAKLRVGVVGLGRGAYFVKVFEGLDSCEVVAVCDPVQKALARFDGLARHTDYDAFLEEGLDVVAVISPGPVHAEQSIKALEAGAHVLCETPCVYSEAEARAVASSVRETGLKYMLAEDYLWSGWSLSIQRLAREGLLGQIVYAEGDYTHDCRDIMLASEEGYVPYAERDRRPDARKTWRATDLPPLYYTSHTLGPLLTFMEDRIVSAIGLNTGTHTAPDLGTIDLEAGLFETEKGAIVRLTNGFSVAHPYALYYNCVGTKGSVKLFSAGASVFIWYSEGADQPDGGWRPAPAEWSDRPDERSQVEAMTGEFVESILHEHEPPLDVARSMDFVLPGVKAHQSSLLGGKKLAVPHVGA